MSTETLGETVNKRLARASEYRREYSWFNPLLLGLILVSFGVLIGREIFRDDSGYATNLYTELISIAVTLGIINVFIRHREQRERDEIQRRLDEQELGRLKALLGSNENVVTKIAVAELRARGWLTNGSLKGANLRESRLDGADLREAGLDGVNLGFAHLGGANLRESRLNGAVLLSARLDGADLGNAHLDGAILQGARLDGAHLEEASLDGAHLHSARLDGANLRRASLDGANLLYASLQHANMWGVKCDENTILPNSEKWASDVDWSQFGAVEIEGYFDWQDYRREHGLLDDEA